MSYSGVFHYIWVKSPIRNSRKRKFHARKVRAGVLLKYSLSFRCHYLRTNETR